MSIIDRLYSMLPTLTATDRKIAQVVLTNPGAVVNTTIAALAKESNVSEASISRFCRTIGVEGFHQLKIELAKVAENRSAYYQEINVDNLQQALSNISANKVAEIEGTLKNASSHDIRKILDSLKQASVILVAAAGDTQPVADDAVYKFNQLGLLAITDSSWETALAQTMNAPADALLLVISNSGETRNLITQIKAAQQRGIAVVAITNRKDSPIGLAADYQLLTAVRQQIFESEYFFSRVAAMTAVEALFLLLLAEDKTFMAHIKAHEALIAETKI